MDFASATAVVNGRLLVVEVLDEIGWEVRSTLS